jgi:hypothetical protein
MLFIPYPSIQDFLAGTVATSGIELLFKPPSNTGFLFFSLKITGAISGRSQPSLSFFFGLRKRRDCLVLKSDRVKPSCTKEDWTKLYDEAGCESISDALINPRSLQ